MINGKKIGIDARMIEKSGIGTYIQHLMGQGIYDYAIGKEDEIRRYDKNVKIIYFDAPIYGPKEQLRFPTMEIKRENIEIIHFPHYNVPFLYSGKYVVTVHDLTHIVFPEFLGNRVKYIYAKILMSHSLRHAKHIFTVSEYSKSDIVKHFKTPDNKISITYNAIDSSFIRKEKAEIVYLYDKYSIPQDKKVILYVGNIKPHKNLGKLLEGIVLSHRKDIVLLLVGKDFNDTSLKTKEQGMREYCNVIHTGMVSKKELVDLYNLADLFAFPSLYEGFGIPPLEAMACGTPVIAADNSSIPEVVGEAAALFDANNAEEIADKINQVLDNEKLKQYLIEEGIKRVHMFSWNETINEIKESIAKII